MAKKKVTRKVAKAPVRKTSRPAFRSTRSVPSRSTKGFFAQHKNLKWILPLFIILLLVLLIVHHYRDEASPNEGEWKDGVRSMLHLNEDDVNGAVLTATPTPGENSTITPYITATPTPDSMNSGY